MGGLSFLRNNMEAGDVYRTVGVPPAQGGFLFMVAHRD